MARQQADIVARVREFAAEHGLLADRGQILVGFSGGADSTALLLLLRELDASVAAIHLHHGLRGADADTDAAWCADFCAQRRIPFECHHLNVPAHRQRGESVEQAARRCRLQFWDKRTANHDAVVALGHHADDSVESLLLRLTRGANASGLTGLRPYRVIGKTAYIRPLLCARRNELEACLHERGVHAWRHDASNDDVTIRRNAVRHRWLPAIESTVDHLEGLHHSLAALALDAEFLEEAARAALPAVGDPTTLAAVHPALLPRVVRLWLQRETGRDIVPDRAVLGRLRTALARPLEAPVEIPLPGGIRLRLSQHGLQTMHQVAPVAAANWPWRRVSSLTLQPEGGRFVISEVQAWADVDPAVAGRNTEYFAESQLPAVLHVRAWRPGDRMIPFGAHSPKKLKDVLTDARIPSWQKAGIPLLLAGDTVIWVAGVRRAEFGRVRQGAQEKVVRVDYLPGS